MEPGRWEEIKRIVNQCLDTDPEARDAQIEQACGGDTAILSEVRSLLASYADLDGFLDTSVLESDDGELPPGGRIGPYEIRSVIGEGGMGRVYLAARTSDFEKRVAIKLVKRGMDTELILRRFRKERQILAGLDHPGIARLLDGGVAEDGRPYLVMEYIEGQPITEYCEGRALRWRERLQLFRAVCAAVQHAHQNLVVHRDLKPGNILVTPEGQPKLLDFGIAKLLDPETDSTITSFRLMTPECASPEQLRGEAVTTATDVYSLGVLLYELITGEKPFQFASRSAEEVARVVCAGEPKNPSTIRRVSKDLDTIVLKAMHREPARRYPSVEQLSDDVERCLAGMPVRARKDSLGYRASKFLARHRVSVAATAVVAAALVAALLFALREAQIATRRFNDLRSLANSLIYDVHDSIKDLPGSTPARKVIVDRALQYLNRLSQDVGGDLALQRELAVAYERVGQVQGQFVESTLGDTQGALLTFGKALEVRQRIAALGDWRDRLALAQDYRLVALQQHATDDFQGASRNIGLAIALTAQLKAARPNDFTVLQELASEYHVSGTLGFNISPREREVRMASYRQAIALDEAMLRLKPEDLPTQHAYADNLYGLGELLQQSDPGAALPFYRRELELERKLHATSSDIRYARGFATTLLHIASVFEDLGDFRQALQYGNQYLGIFQELIRLDPRNATLQASLAIAYGNTAWWLANTGDTSKAMEYANRSLEMIRSRVASDPKNAYYERKIAELAAVSAQILMLAHRPAAALKSFDDSRAVYESLYRNSPGAFWYLVDTARPLRGMGDAAALLGDSAHAGGYYRQALAVVEPRLAEEPEHFTANQAAANSYSGLGDLALREALVPGRDKSSRRAACAEARSWYLKSLEAWKRIERLRHPIPTAPGEGNPAVVEKNLRRCEEALN